MWKNIFSSKKINKIINDYESKMVTKPGRNLGRVFNSRRGCMCTLHLCCCVAKWPNLKLKNSAQTTFRFSPISFHILSVTNTIFNKIKLIQQNILSIFKFFKTLNRTFNDIIMKLIMKSGQN